MLEDFLNGNLNVRLTKEDIPLLGEFQKQAGIRWASGDSINSSLTRRYINVEYGGVLRVHAEPGYSDNVCMWVASTDSSLPCVSLEELLQSNKDFEIAEEDVLSLLGE